MPLPSGCSRLLGGAPLSDGGTPAAQELWRALPVLCVTEPHLLKGGGVKGASCLFGLRGPAAFLLPLSVLAALYGPRSSWEGGCELFCPPNARLSLSLSHTRGVLAPFSAPLIQAW